MAFSQKSFHKENNFSRFCKVKVISHTVIFNFQEKFSNSFSRAIFVYILTFDSIWTHSKMTKFENGGCLTAGHRKTFSWNSHFCVRRGAILKLEDHTKPDNFVTSKVSSVTLYIFFLTLKLKTSFSATLNSMGMGKSCGEYKALLLCRHYISM